MKQVSQRWIVFGLTSGLISLMQLDLLTIGAILPDVARDLRADGRQVGLLLAIFTLIFAVLQLPAGLLFSRGHQRWILTLSAAAVGAGNSLFALADTFWVAAFGRLLSGAGGAFFFLGFTSLMGRLFAPLEFGRILGANQMIKLFLATATLLVLPALLVAVGWRGYLSVIAALFALLAVGVFLWVPSLGAMDEGPPPPPGQQFRGVLREANVWRSAFAAGLGSGCLIAFVGSWCEPFLIAAGVSQRVATWLVAAALIGLGSGIFFFGWLSDRLQRRKSPLVVSCLLGGLGFGAILLWPEQSLPRLAALLFTAAGLGAAATVLPFALAKESVPAASSSVAISVTNFVSYLCMAFLQLFPGLLLGAHFRDASLQSFRLALLAVPLSLFAAALIGLGARETGGRQA